MQERKLALPWSLESAKDINGKDYQMYSIHDYLNKNILVNYYSAANNNFWWRIVDENLRSLAYNHPLIMPHITYSLTGGFVKTQTEARNILEGFLKSVGYQIINEKLVSMA